MSNRPKKEKTPPKCDVCGVELPNREERYDVVAAIVRSDHKFRMIQQKVATLCREHALKESERVEGERLEKLARQKFSSPIIDAVLKQEGEQTNV